MEGYKYKYTSIYVAIIVTLILGFEIWGAFV